MRLIAVIVVFILSTVVPDAQVATSPLVGGGELSLSRDGEFIVVSIKGPAAGIATVCVGDASRVRILHASAAVGEAMYEKEGERWVLKSGFTFALREVPDAGLPTTTQVNEFLATFGWVSKASRTPTPDRQFRIRHSDRIQFLGVSHLSLEPKENVAHWPETMGDDCRSVKVNQGFLPDTAQFRPETWHPMRPVVIG